MTDDLKMTYPPSEEELEQFPGQVALQVIYENYARDCTKCELHKTRNSVVFGYGATERPPIAFVGEAPGQNEDEQGYPFVGRAGKLLTKMIEAMGYKRDQVYICNVLCCRPPNNADPTSEQVEACTPILAGQLKAVQPKTIVCLGAAAANGMLRTKGRKVAEFRGKWHAWDKVPVRVTYHPAALLRSEGLKPSTWEDLQAVLKRLKDSGDAGPLFGS